MPSPSFNSTILRHGVIAALSLLAVAVCTFAIRAFLENWFAEPPIVQACLDRVGTHRMMVDIENAAYWNCVDRRAKLFLEMDYAESKDLSKAFLTLLTAVLVASISFSEKIVDIHRSNWWARGLMIAAWVFFLVAIVTCGTALALMTIAAGYASYAEHMDFRPLEGNALVLYIASGASFGCGLAALLVAGVVSMLHPPLRVAAEPVAENAPGVEEGGNRR